MSEAKPSEEQPVIEPNPIELVKKDLLDIGEDVVKDVIERVVRPGLKAFLAKSSVGKYLAGVVDPACDFLLGLADKIDGKVG